MKKYLLSLLALAFVFILRAQEREPYMTKSLTADNVKSVDVQTSGGSISLAGVEAAQARVDVYITGNNGKDNLSKEEIQKRLNELYTLTVSVSGNELTAVAKPKEKIKDWKKALNISFKVFVPKSITSRLHTSGGSITVENVSGDQKFSTSGGSLHVSNTTGKINGRTSGGGIQVQNAKDDIELTTSGGDIEAKDCDGKLRLTTSGGSLQLKNLKGVITASTSGGGINGKNIGGELETHTSGGSINLDDLTCSLEASTSGGHISVTMKEFGKYLKVSNHGGNIDLELPKGKGATLEISGSKIRVDQLDNFSGKIEDDEVDGKLNGGGVPVTVKASSGRVSLALK